MRAERRPTRAAALKPSFKLEDTSFESEMSYKHSESMNYRARPADDIDGYQFTVTAIANAMGMHKEEKTISRVLYEVRKVHTNIKQLNVRNGKIFQYYYFINQSSPVKLSLGDVKSIKLEEEPRLGVDEKVKDEFRAYSSRLNKLNASSFWQIRKMVGDLSEDDIQPQY